MESIWGIYQCVSLRLKIVVILVKLWMYTWNNMTKCISQIISSVCKYMYGYTIRSVSLTSLTSLCESNTIFALPKTWKIRYHASELLHKTIPVAICIRCTIPTAFHWQLNSIKDTMKLCQKENLWMKYKWLILLRYDGKVVFAFRFLWLVL